MTHQNLFTETTVLSVENDYRRQRALDDFHAVNAGRRRRHGGSSGLRSLRLWHRGAQVADAS